MRRWLIHKKGIQMNSLTDAIEKYRGILLASDFFSNTNEGITFLADNDETDWLISKCIDRHSRCIVAATASRVCWLAAEKHKAASMAAKNEADCRDAITQERQAYRAAAEFDSIFAGLCAGGEGGK
jgi:hypothetical protein